VRLFRLGSVTHPFDANSLALSLDLTKGDGRISVTAPVNAHVPPRMSARLGSGPRGRGSTSCRALATFQG
jgi:hypothetical protein